MTVIEKNNCKIAVIDRDVRISATQDLLDLLVLALYDERCSNLIVYQESLGEEFFDLKTGVAGELLQKCSNYHIRLVIVGDFSAYTSKSLRDFMYECNKGHQIFFVSDSDSAAKRFPMMSE